MLGHVRVFPPPIWHGLLEVYDIDVFHMVTVRGDVVGDVLGEGIILICVGIFKRLTHVSLSVTSISVWEPSWSAWRRR